MRNQLLRDADWGSMAHSVEVRVPFVDYALLSQLAPMIAGPSPPTKADMIEPFHALLPPAVARRSKTGFGIPVGQWLAHTRTQSMADAAHPPWLRRGLRPWALHVYDHFARNV
jgi:asparagine synthase (glutamine-hydrolysing)